MHIADALRRNYINDKDKEGNEIEIDIVNV